MGEAILSRLIEKNIYKAKEILVSEPLAKRRDYLAHTYQIQATSHNSEVAHATEILLLAIKPQVLEKVVQGLGMVQHSPLIISILAGVTLSRLEAAFPQRAIIRAMPNTPATVGEGMTAIALNSFVGEGQIIMAKTLFTAIGEVVEVPESLMDGVTGLSGSGPAYVAIMVEALADGGVAAGLPRAIAHQLALQTVFGTAQLLQQKKIHPAQLKDQVTSPGGTTIAGVAQLEKSGFRSAIIEAVKSAYQRSQELGSQ